MYFWWCLRFRHFSWFLFIHFDVDYLLPQPMRSSSFFFFFLLIFFAKYAFDVASRRCQLSARWDFSIFLRLRPRFHWWGFFSSFHWWIDVAIDDADASRWWPFFFFLRRRCRLMLSPPFRCDDADEIIFWLMPFSIISDDELITL